LTDLYRELKSATWNVGPGSVELVTELTLKEDPKFDVV
jgi:hypothetical protein